MTINLFYLSPNTTGGWVTFTYHLHQSLRRAGLKCRLLKVGGKTENKLREFGYDLQYRNVDLPDALITAQEYPTLIVAAAKKYKEQTEALLRAGSKIVVHDPTEFKNLPGNLEQERCVVIRKASLAHLPKARFIRHPYVLMPTDNLRSERQLAVSTCRIDFDKNTHILLDANRILREKISIYGFENRLYTRFKICPRYPEWEQSKVAYPRTPDAAFNILKRAKYAVDMSIIKGDGGGTQYSFLEAWDAGAVPIIHKDWVMKGDDMIPGENCLAVSSGDELAALLGSYSPTAEANRLHYADKGRERIKIYHDVGLEYEEFLNAGH